jgi:RNA polymerase sigma-70 factor (ECF subfamily)
MLEFDTEQLLTLAQSGDFVARQQLLSRHRERLRRMVQIYLDPRVSARVDPSDVLQEALTAAAINLPDYFANRPIPFYPWLRQFVRDELIRIHRRHVQAARRSIRLESRFGGEVSDASAMQLADQLVGRESSPSQHLHREELNAQVKNSLAQLSESDRELLLMRCVEQLSIDEITSILSISETAAKSRLRRAMQKLTRLMGSRS